MRAGTSRIDITPPKGVSMGGYLARTKGAEGIHDPLFVRALVLEDGERRVALLSVDLAAVDRPVSSDIRRRIEQETAIPAAQVMLACTHTHAGPLVATRRISELSVSYHESVQDKLGLPVEKFAINIDRWGNTSSASIGLALDEERRAGRAQPGDLVVLIAFGAGLTWGILVFRM